MNFLRLLFSDSYDPWFNLSLEEYIFKNMIQDQSILFLWRNNNTVVIGRSQNAWKECNTRRMARDNIQLARRASGGGAVFQDLGNTCFTFMSTQKNYNKNISFNIILNSLHKLGVKALISGRNDLVVNTKQGHRKISGSAYRKKLDRQFHHGTLLLNVNLNKLTYYLNPDYKKLKTKGITSIRSRVINLNELQPNINHEKVCQQLQESFCQYYKMTVKPEILSINNFSHMPGFITQLNKQRCWNWNFGNTPAFTHQLSNQFNWGNIECCFDIQCGMIKRSYIYTDSLDPIPLEKLSKKLVGILYNTQSIQYFYKTWKANYLPSPEVEEVINWLIQNIA